VLRTRKALGVVYSYDYDNGIEGPWYSVVCSIPNYDVEAIPSGNTRSKVRRSLKRCEVRLVEPAWLAEHGYATFQKATEQYGRGKEMSREELRRKYAAFQGREDVKVFGVFVGEDLAAYGMTFARNEVVRIGPAKFDPAFSNAYPMYALYFSMAQHYLNLGPYRYIDNGTRSILHETNIEEFLSSLGWRRAFCRADYLFRPAFEAALQAARISSPIWQRVVKNTAAKQLSALLELRRLARVTSRTGPARPLEGAQHLGS
jgi:hypothetical protein